MRLFQVYETKVGTYIGSLPGFRFDQSDHAEDFSASGLPVLSPRCALEYHSTLETISTYLGTYLVRHLSSAVKVCRTSESKMSGPRTARMAIRMLQRLNRSNAIHSAW